MTTIHLRDETRPHMSLCGLGYDWPSTIPLARKGEEATCRGCLDRCTAAEVETIAESMSVAAAREVVDHREEYPAATVTAAEEIMTAAGWE
jgi:hypothetical protein